MKKEGLSTYPVANKLRIQGYVIKYLQKEGLIHTPINKEDEIRLQFLNDIWGKTFYIRAQLTKMKKAERMSFLSSAPLSRAWERWLYTRYLNHYLYSKKKELNKAELKEELIRRFRRRNDTELERKFRKIRNLAQQSARQIRKEVA